MPDAASNLDPLPPDTSYAQLIQRVQDLTDLVRMHRHTGSDLTQPLLNTSISGGSLVNGITLGDGLGKSGSLQLLVAKGRGSSQIYAGITAGDFANAAAKNGFILGIDDSDSQKVKFYFGAPGHYIQYDGSSLTIAGNLTAGSLDIPNTTTANSFHVDTNGNTWWGANVASGYLSANAYILNTGAALFKNAQIGGSSLQYAVGDAGIFSYGDGSDNAATCDGSTAVNGMTLAGSTYTMTRDVYFTTLVVNNGVTVNPGGYRIFCRTSLTVNGTIQRNGNAGNNGTIGALAASVPGGTGGAALADGYLKGSAAGGDGSNGTAGNASPASNGTSVTNSIGASASSGANGGQGSAAGTAGVAGTPGTATLSNVKLIANWHLATLLDISSSGSTVKFNNSASPSGGGGGSGATVPNLAGGGGGGGGSAGGILAIYAKTLTVGATGVISVNGGKGGNGGDGVFVNAGRYSAGGGGGGGGNGGQLILVYNMYTNAGSVTATAGVGGTGGGSGGAGGIGGSTAANGTAGTVYQFQLSL